jgi:hypothetical protein
MSEVKTADVTATVDTYFDMWNEDDEAQRKSYIERAWTSEGHYVDPLQEAQGVQGLSDMVAAVHAQFPGHQFRRTTGVDMHHSLVRFGWELAGPDGSITVAGLDVGIVTDDGKLVRIGGFFGELPEKDA